MYYYASKSERQNGHRLVTDSHLWLTLNPSEGGFLCSQKHSKVSFEMLEILSASQKSLPLQGLAIAPKSHLAVSTCGAFEWWAFVVITLKFI